MHSSSYLFPFLAAITTVLGAPTNTSSLTAVDASTQVCDASHVIPDQGYLVMANVYAPGQGHQCAKADGGSKSGIAWQTTWDWVAGTNSDPIKSYANAYAQGKTPCKPLNQISQIPSTWQWNMNADHSKPITADVSYDIFLSPGGACDTTSYHAYEVMIWLASYGQVNGQPFKPLGNDGGVIGSYTYTNQNKEKFDFDLYKGFNSPSGGRTEVYSFFPKGGKKYEHFDGNLAAFLHNVQSHDGGIAGATLQSVQAGVEAVSGKATFKVSEFSVGN